MEAISFIEIKEFLISELRKNSIDTIYFQKHPLFQYDENSVITDTKKIISIVIEKFNISRYIFDKYDLNKTSPQFKYNTYDLSRLKQLKQSYHRDISEINIIEEKIKEIDKKNEEHESLKVLLENSYDDFDEFIHTVIKKIKRDLDEDTIQDLRESFNDKISNFQKWIEKNDKVISNYDWQKDLKKDNLSEKIKKIETSTTEKEKALSKAKTELQNIISKIENIESNIDDSPKKKVEYEKLIETNRIKIEKEIKQKSPNQALINELFDENKELPIKAEKDLKKLQKELKKQHKKQAEKENEKISLENDLQNNNKELKKLIAELNTLEKDKTTFDVEKEKEAKDCILEFLFGEVNSRNNKTKNHLSKIFLEAYLNEKIDSKLSIDTLKSFFKQEIINPIEYLVYEELKNDEVRFARINNNPLSEDLIAPLYFAFNRALKTGNFRFTSNGKIYVDFKNGIFAKIIVRKRHKDIPNKDLIALFKIKEERDFTLYKSSKIFSGYTDSGFYLFNGVYIVHNDLVFEIFFDADAILLSSPYYQQQIISNASGAKCDDEKAAEEDLWDDDDF
jgi:chromosome segregation ATPase